MQKAEDKKTVDYNDFWLIKNNPLSKVGVFPYLGSQISPDLEPDKIYMVYRPEEELSRPEVLETFKLIPITDEHTMLGTGAGMMPAEKKGVHGVTGENSEYHNGLITCDIKIYSEQLKQEIENGKKDLSVGYFCRYELTPGVYNGQPYDAIQRDIKVNHIALVDEGRMGKDVRVMDSNINIKPLKEKTDMEENKACDEDIRNRNYAMDASVPLQTAATISNPVQFFQYWEPEAVEIVTAAMKIDDIVGRTIAGNFEDEEIVVTVMERTGSAHPYTDTANINLASWNQNFMARSIVRFEEGLEVGYLESLRASRMRIDTHKEKAAAAALSLAIEHNNIGFYGYANGLNKTYGLLTVTIMA